LTNKYISSTPDDSRAAKLGNQFHWGDAVTEDRIAKVRKLNAIAQARGQDMAQMAVAWVLRHRGMTSALIGASRPEQIDDVVASLDKLAFSEDELAAIEAILAG
jgi:L-glyceraldehyde 3-phosphate reductase